MREPRNWLVGLSAVVVLDAATVLDLEDTLRWRNAVVDYDYDSAELSVIMDVETVEATAALADVAMAVGAWAGLRQVTLHNLKAEVWQASYVGPHDRGHPAPRHRNLRLLPTPVGPASTQ